LQADARVRRTRRVAKEAARNDHVRGDDRAAFGWWRELADELADEGSPARGVVRPVTPRSWRH